MKYVMMIYGDESKESSMSEAEQQAVFQEYFAFTNHVRERGVYHGGEALQATRTATTVRVRDGKTVTTDGPFAETHEQLGGYYLIDAKDLDEAIEIAARIPGARYGSIEIRPIVDFS